MHPKADRGPKLAGPYQLGRAGSRRVEAGHDQHDAVVAGASGGNNGAVAGFGEDAGGDANTLGARGALDSDAGGGTHPPVVGGGDGEGGVCGHGREYLPSVSSTMADAAGVTVTDLLHTPVRKLGLNNLSVVDFGFNRNAPTIIPPPPPPQLGAGTHDFAAPPPGYEAITPASSNNAHSIGGRGLSRDAGGGGNALLGGGLAPCGFAGVEGAVGGAASGGFPSSAAEHARGDDRRGEYEERERSWQPAWQSEAAVRPCELQRFQAQHAASSWQREQALLVLSRQQALLLQSQQEERQWPLRPVTRRLHQPPRTMLIRLVGEDCRETLVGAEMLFWEGGLRPVDLRALKVLSVGLRQEVFHLRRQSMHVVMIDVGNMRSVSAAGSLPGNRRRLSGLVSCSDSRHNMRLRLGSGSRHYLFCLGSRRYCCSCSRCSIVCCNQRSLSLLLLRAVLHPCIFLSSAWELRMTTGDGGNGTFSKDADRQTRRYSRCGSILMASS